MAGKMHRVRRVLVVCATGVASAVASAWGAPAPVPETGQVTCWDAAGLVIPCAGTGQDGDLRRGAEWPVPRFTDNADGTVTDNLTALVWLKNANCFGNRDWAAALTDANTLASGSCGLTDGTAAGDWRLPSVQELQSLIDYEFSAPALSNAAGTAQWTEGDAFSDVQLLFYWSSTSDANNPANGWFVNFDIGSVINAGKIFTGPVLPVRGGGLIFADGFETGDLSAWSAGGTSAPVPATGQTTCWDAAGTVISCAGTGHDGDLRRGVKWPVPRFTDNTDGTVTDNLTDLIWLKDASCTDLAGVDGKGAGVWTMALSAAAALLSGTCGLTDGSVVGDWRLPNVQELQSLIDYEFASPALSDTAGTAQWTEGDPFSGFEEILPYWSSTSEAGDPSKAWFVGSDVGTLVNVSKTDEWVVWPVRGGQ